MEIQVGEYVRTKDGFIRKIDKIKKCSICEEKEYINKEIMNGLLFKNICHKKDIENHSFKPIDLIEVGDYVNGYKVDEVRISCFDSMIYINDYKQELHENDIKSIVTKEQFESMKYKLEE